MNRTTIGISIFLLLLVLSINVSAQDTIDYLVNWNPNPEPDITGYVLYRSLDRETSFEAIDSVGNETFNYIDEGLEKGTRYYYRLVAKNTSGERSSFSNPVSGMAIPDDAAQSLQDSCKITTHSHSGDTYTLNWETLVSTNGYIQYDSDAVLDSMSNWDDTDYAITHAAELQNLEADTTYYAKAVAYDEYDNLTISTRDTFFTANSEDPAPLSAPLLSIYPVPYHPLLDDMTMKGLPLNGAVRIFNSNGMEIYKENEAGGEISWNGTNHNGSKVMSGVYYVIVEDSSGKITSKKPIIIVN